MTDNDSVTNEPRWRKRLAVGALGVTALLGNACVSQSESVQTAALASCLERLESSLASPASRQSEAVDVAAITNAGYLQRAVAFSRPVPDGIGERRDYHLLIEVGKVVEAEDGDCVLVSHAVQQTWTEVSTTRTYIDDQSLKDTKAEFLMRMETSGWGDVEFVGTEPMEPRQGELYTHTFRGSVVGHLSTKLEIAPLDQASRWFEYNDASHDAALGLWTLATNQQEPLKCLQELTDQRIGFLLEELESGKSTAELVFERATLAPAGIDAMPLILQADLAMLLALAGAGGK